MSDPTFRLPARPSLSQLRTRAKELLRQIRANDPGATARFRAVTRNKEPARARLADAQFVLAREYGFQTWALLVRHLETVQPSRLEAFDRLARDLVAAYRSEDTEALSRLNAVLSGAVTLDRLRTMVDERMTALAETPWDSNAFSLDAARHLLARQFGFRTWTQLAQSTSQPPGDPFSAKLGLSATPPFYRINRTENTLEVVQLLSPDDWDTILDVMRNSAITGLNANGQMTDVAMKRLAHLDHVTRLDLGGTKRITDDGLRSLADMPALETLDLSDSPGGQITDRGLEALGRLPNLRVLQMCWQSRVSDRGVANLRACERLERVDLMGTPTGDGTIEALAGKSGLRHLKTGRLLTDAGLRFLHDLPAFRAWEGGEVEYGLMGFDAGPTFLLLDGPFTDRGLASLAGLNGLFGLSIFWHANAFTADGLAGLAALANLGFLGCDGKRCDDRAMHHIGGLPGLRMLMAQGTVAGDPGFTALSRSQTIEHIWGRECPNLGSRGFAALASMPALRGLAVSCKHVTDHALSSLADFPSLTALMPMDVPDEGFRHVGRCQRLEDLWCMYCRDTGDRATEHLSNLTTLRTYYAGHTRITDRSLDLLSALTSIEKIELYGCSGITDAGIGSLARLPRLREITVEGSPNVTREGMAAIADRVNVQYRM